MITADPTVSVVRLQPTDSVLVLACDGIYDVLTDEEVLRLARATDDPQEGGV